MKKLIIILLIIGKSITSLACSCYNEDPNWGRYDQPFYNSLNTVFVGKITKVKYEGTIRYYEVEVLRSFKGDIKEKILIRDSESCWAAGFQENKIYLINPYKSKNGYGIDKCRFNCSAADRSFKSDTLFLNYFGQKNVYVDHPEIKGRIVDGKKEGEWFYYYNKDSLSILQYSAYYEKGVPIRGKSYNKQKKIEGEDFYEKGKLKKTIDFFNDTTSLVSTYNLHSSKRYHIIDDTTYYMMEHRIMSSQIILYNDKGEVLTKIRKTPFIRNIIDYHANGKIKGKGRITMKYYYTYGKWRLYDENGKKYIVKFLRRGDYLDFEDFFYSRCTNTFYKDLSNTRTGVE